MTPEQLASFLHVIILKNKKRQDRKIERGKKNFLNLRNKSYRFEISEIEIAIEKCHPSSLIFIHRLFDMK